MKNCIKNYIDQSIKLKKNMMEDDVFISQIEGSIELIKKAILNNKKILLAGNGGSAADCSHLATEFCVKFEKNRKPIRAISLCCDNSIISAVSNDFSYDKVFSRQIEALADSDDIFFAISTSGKSKNILEGIKKANKLGLKIILLTGNDPDSEIVKLCDFAICVQEKCTSLIQEMHLTVEHIIAREIEKDLV